MVAPITILQEMSGRVNVAPLTVEQYESMNAVGILPDGVPIELLDGLLVWKDRAAAGADPMAIGTHHQLGVNKLSRLARQVEKWGCYLAVQGPVRIVPSSEPEPDAAVIRGKPEDYAERHPGPRDVYSVIEVADSSLARDRITKCRIYASAGVRQYVIVNLVERQVEIYSSPVARQGRYAGETIRKGNQIVGILAGPTGTGPGKVVKIAAKDLLP